MWIPRTWEQIEALIGEPEAEAFEFKRELPVSGSNADVAKDIAAMSVSGGVLVYGLEEDSDTGVAGSIRPVQLVGARERFQQITGTRVRPPCPIEVLAVASPDDAAAGVVIVAVPPSSSAPHMVGDRFPVRRGTTTSSLTENEIARLYARRAAATTDGPSSSEILRARPASIARHGGPDIGGISDDIGVLRIVFLPIGPVRHASAPWLEHALGGAYARTLDRHVRRFQGGWTSPANGLAQWTPYPFASIGWTAGRSTSNLAADPQPQNPDHFSFAAVAEYSGRVSFQATRYLRVPVNAMPPRDDFHSAYEDDIVRYTTFFAALAGEIYQDFEGIGPVRAVAELAGFSGAVSHQATRDTIAPWTDHLPKATHHLGADLTNRSELTAAPETVAARLLDPWLATFCADGSVWTRLLPPDIAS